MEKKLFKASSIRRIGRNRILRIITPSYYSFILRNFYQTEAKLLLEILNRERFCCIRRDIFQSLTLEHVMHQISGLKYSQKPSQHSKDISDENKRLKIESAHLL